MKYSSNEDMKQKKTAQETVEKIWADSTVVSKEHQRQFSEMIKDTELRARGQGKVRSAWCAESNQKASRKLKAVMLSSGNVMVCYG
jgi:hypothetical protein